MYNKYPEDFKRQAVIACQTSGLTKGQVCRSLGILLESEDYLPPQSNEFLTAEST